MKNVVDSWLKARSRIHQKSGGQERVEKKWGFWCEPDDRDKRTTETKADRVRQPLGLLWAPAAATCSCQGHRPPHTPWQASPSLIQHMGEPCASATPMPTACAWYVLGTNKKATHPSDSHDPSLLRVRYVWFFIEYGRSILGLVCLNIFCLVS